MLAGTAPRARRLELGLVTAAGPALPMGGGVDHAVELSPTTTPPWPCQRAGGGVVSSCERPRDRVEEADALEEGVGGAPEAMFRPGDASRPEASARERLVGRRLLPAALPAALRALGRRGRADAWGRLRPRRPRSLSLLPSLSSSSLPAARSSSSGSSNGRGGNGRGGAVTLVTLGTLARHPVRALPCAWSESLSLPLSLSGSGSSSTSSSLLNAACWC